MQLGLSHQQTFAFSKKYKHQHSWVKQGVRKLFHLISKISISVILPLICILIEIAIFKRQNKTIIFKNIFLKWLCFWVIGFSAISVGVMQAFNPSYTADLLHVNMSDFIIVQELGYAQLGIGIVALLSLKWVQFKKPAVIAYGTFIFGCTVIHFLRFSAIDLGEIISTLNDIWILIVAALIVINKENNEIADCHSLT